MVSRVKEVFGVLLVSVVVFLLTWIYSGEIYYRKEVEFLPSMEPYIVNNTNCKIPGFAPFHESKYLIVARRKICPKTIDYTHHKANKLLVNITGLTIFCNGTLKHCEYNDIIWVDDNRIKYSPAIKFNGDVTVTSEFIRVKCFCSKGIKVYTNFHAFVLPRKNSSSSHFHVQNANMLNVVMIGLDSVSRLNSHRQLSDTRTFLLTKLHALELFGYNKIGDNTFFNILAMLFGKYHYDIGWTVRTTKKFDEYDQILKTFRQRGYRTMFVEDASDMPVFSHGRQGFNRPPADHYFRPISIAIYKDRHMLSRDHMCMRGRLYMNVILNYVYDFLKLYKSENHFVFNFNSYPSHNQLNSAGRIDYDLRDFFAKIHNEQLLNNTLLFLFSDHGIRQGKFRETFMGKLEERLPMMYIVPPKWLPVKFPKLWGNLKNNSVKLTTPFDIHETLLTVFNLREFESKLSKIDLNARGISLFAPVPENRTCEAATIKSHWCTCQTNKKLPTDDTYVVKAAALLVTYINGKLRTEKKNCVTLMLHNIKGAVITTSSDQMMMSRTCKSHYDLESCKLHAKSSRLPYLYDLTVTTVPGFAIFEATVDYYASKNIIKTRGDISRINLYGNQSMCTSRLDLKKYCYCK